MLLKKLLLKDFRQFKGEQKIDFSLDHEKNVTIIFGENGTGKTTFAQAFTWCLYGETPSFSDKNLLCKATAQEMKPNDEEKVFVVLEFIHNNIEYICTSMQLYYKDSVGNIKTKGNRKFTMEYKGKDGQQKFVRENQLDGEINKILPKELSSYFFFDGERIGNMSKEITKGRSKEFPEAVKSLLGLSAFENALNHLNGSYNQNSVVKSYKKSFDSSGNEELKKIILEIERLEDQRDSASKRIIEIEEKDLPTVVREKERIIAEQKKFSNIELLVKERNDSEEQLQGMENLRQMNVKDFLSSFSKDCYNFFLLKKIDEVEKLLSDADIKESGIPDIHKRTIDFLIQRGKCVCGTKIEKDSDIYRHLIEQLKYIPPQSLGTSIRQFISVANEKSKNGDFVKNIDELYGRIRKVDEDISSQNEKISGINKYLSGIDENGIAKLQKDLEYYTNKERDFLIEKGSCIEAVKSLESEISGKEQSKDRFTNIGATNKKISNYLAYAKYIFDEMQQMYKSEEAKVRNQFENTINTIFKKIYNGGLSLKIDEKYNIKIIVNDFKGYNDDVETSTAQSLSVILAFISAVIKMARENQDGGSKLLVTEAYPLVMDAPLSAFDKTRIQTICEVLPNIAEQVIVFINDKDGEVAEKNMQDKISAKFGFKKINEFETYMEVR
jgi:DNA sulfur modification protein DndD